MGEDIFTINILINGVRMPLTVPRADEVLYRDAEKLLNNYLNKYQERFNQRSMEEVLTVVAYQLAVIITKQNMNQDVTPLAQKIQDINQELEELLS